MALALTGTLVASPTPVGAVDQVLYAKPVATGSGDCSSWENACPLQDALLTAAAGDQIWVAQGTYTPGTSRSDSFGLKDGVAIYGGFAGNETLVSQRNANPGTNHTKLSGDIGTIGDATDNSYHVVTAEGVGSTTFLDGFAIAGGRTIGATETAGAGMMVHQGSPVLSNLLFTDNIAANDGGGLAVSCFEPGYSFLTCLPTAPSLTGVRFEGNAAAGDGGGMIVGTGVETDASKTQVSLSDVTFANNRSTGDFASGGGLELMKVSAELQSVRFTGNSAGAGGGGLDVYQGAVISIADAIFSGNAVASATVGSAGGAVNNAGTLTINGAIFLNNQATLAGGAVYSAGSSPTLTVINAIFAGNRTQSLTGDGGALSMIGGSATLTNATLYGNTSYLGGAVYAAVTTVALRNAVVAGNTGTGQIYCDTDATTNVLSSLVQGGCPDGATCSGVTSDAPVFVNATDPDGPDNALLTPDDGLALTAYSPGIDAGDNGYITGFDKDAVGLSRIVNVTVDMGAYEYQGSAPATHFSVVAPTGVTAGATFSVTVTALDASENTATGYNRVVRFTSTDATAILPANSALTNGTGTFSATLYTLGEQTITATDTAIPSITGTSGTITIAGRPAAILRVKVDATGTPRDGSDWDHAYADLQSALRASLAGDEIWLAQGIYKPTSTSNRSASFVLRDGVKIYGGFAGTETTLAERNWVTRETVLSGDIGTPGVATDNSYHVVSAPGGVSSTAVLDGFTISGGKADPPLGGGGIFVDAGSPTLRNLVIKQNAAEYGGGVYVYGGGTPTLTNAVVAGNSAFVGGGIRVGNGRLALANVIVHGNSAGYEGGGIALGYPNGSVSVVNSIVWGNTPSQIGTGAATVTYSDIQGGRAGTGNISADPLFVSAATGDLHLQLGSPAIDAGSNAGVPSGVTTDLGGNPRIVGSAVDMGAYEYQGAANTAPSDIALSSSTVDENLAAGTMVGTLSTTDGDASDVFTYSLVEGDGDTDNASFSIDGDTLKTAAAFDYESKSSYSARVRTTDSGGLYFDEAFTILVSDVNEAPTDISLGNSSVAENQPSGTAVGTFSTTDPDTSQGFASTLVIGPVSTYSLVTGSGDTDNASFTIAANELQTAAVFDYEAKSSYSIRVRSTDSGTLWTEKAFIISVTDASEPPTISDLADQTIDEDGSTGALDFTVGDPETAAGGLTVEGSSSNTGLVPEANIVFGGSGANRTVTISPTLNASGSTTITITVSDGFLTEWDSFTLTVSAVNDAPVNGVPPAQSTPAGTALVFSQANGSAISVADVDAGSNSIELGLSVEHGTLTLVGTSGLTFTVGDGTADAAMTFSGTLDSANAALAGLSYSATSGYAGPDALTIVSDDQGHTGSGGAKSDTDTVAITVEAAVAEPNTTITAGPAGWTSDATPTFQFSSDVAGATFECSDDSGPFEPCTTPHTMPALPDGPHTCTVRAVSNTMLDSTPAERSFTVDTTLPYTGYVEVVLREGGQVASGPVLLSWQASDNLTLDAQLRHQIEIRRVRADGTRSAWRDRITVTGVESSWVLPLWRTFEYRVRTRDLANNWSVWEQGAPITLIRRQEQHFTLGAAWTIVDYLGAMKSHVARNLTPGATAQLSFIGNGVALVMPAAAGQGVIEVCIDPGSPNAACRTLDLAAFRPAGNRRLVAAFTELPTTSHVLRVKVLSGIVNLDGALISR